MRSNCCWDSHSTTRRVSCKKGWISSVAQTRACSPPSLLLLLWDVDGCGDRVIVLESIWIRRPHENRRAVILDFSTLRPVFRIHVDDWPKRCNGCFSKKTLPSGRGLRLHWMDVSVVEHLWYSFALLFVILRLSQHCWSWETEEFQQQLHNHERPQSYIVFPPEGSEEELEVSLWRVILKIKWMFCCCLCVWLPVCSVLNLAELTCHSPASGRNRSLTYLPLKSPDCRSCNRADTQRGAGGSEMDRTRIWWSLAVRAGQPHRNDSDKQKNLFNNK